MNNSSREVVKICTFAGEYGTFIVVHFPSDRYVANQIVFCVVNCVLMLSILILNGVSVLTISKCPKLQKKICCFLILVQSMVDFLVGLISLPLITYIRASEIIALRNSCALNFVSETIVYLMFGLSLSIVSVLTLERYTSILNPVVHRLRYTKSNILISVFSIIGAMLLFSTLRLASDKLYRFSSTIFVFITLAANAFAYVKIFLVARKTLHSKRVAQDSSSQESSMQTSRNTRKELLHDLKLAKSCALVVFTSFLCFLPAPVIYLSFKEATLAMRIAHSWSITFGALNSSLNSVIFFWKRPLLRIEALKLLKTLFFTT